MQLSHCPEEEGSKRMKEMWTESCGQRVENEKGNKKNLEPIRGCRWKRKRQTLSNSIEGYSHNPPKQSSFFHWSFSSLPKLITYFPHFVHTVHNAKIIKINLMASGISSEITHTELLRKVFSQPPLQGILKDNEQYYPVHLY